jgi:beta-lactamase class A
MHRSKSTLIALSGWFLTLPAGAQDPKLSAATPQIQKRIADSHADVAIALHSLDGQTEWFYHADEPFHAASTMKIPVMIELFHQAAEHKLRTDETLVIHNEFHSIVDGSVYQLHPADDSETTLYQAEGQTRTLSQLCVLMIMQSSNLATNLLIDKLGIENIRATAHAYGADGMIVLRGVEDGKAFEKGMNNTTTARALLTLLSAIAGGEAVNSMYSKVMVDILQKQQFNDGIPAGLPHDIHVAHKTGEITKINHDAAIVYAPRPYILVVLVRGIADQKISSQLIADISRTLYPVMESGK